MTSNLNCKIRSEGLNVQLFVWVSIILVAKKRAPKHKISFKPLDESTQDTHLPRVLQFPNSLDTQLTESSPALPVQRSFDFDPDIENQMGCSELFEDSLTLPC